MSEVEIKELPENWAWATFGDVAELLRGVSYKKPDASKEPEAGKLPVLRANNIGYGLNFDDLVYVPERLIKEEQYIKKGDIIIAMSSGSKHLVGKAAQANDDFNGGYGAFCANLRVTSEIEPKYVAYFYSRQENIKRISDSSKGSNINNLKREHILGAPIPIAPSEQQNRIVAKIEELFSHIDAGIKALKKAKQLLKQYRQSVLKIAVTGELTKEWREANKAKLEPASELLETIEKRRQDAYEEELEKWNELVEVLGKSGNNEKKPAKPKKPKIIESLSDEEVGELHSLPNGWLWVKLSQVATKITDGEHFKPPVQDNGVYFLSAKDVRDEGVSFENPLYISEETAAKALLRCNPENGDILIVSRGATVGRMCVVNTDEVFCLLGSVILIKVAEGINSWCLLHLMKSPDVNEKIANVSGATAQQAIYLRDIQHVAIPLCSVEEQNQIEQIVGEKMDSIFRLEKELEFQLTMGEKNKQAILVEAFSGKLVEPLKSEEPASVLLENIREKSKSVVVTKRGKSAEKVSAKQEVSMRRAILDILKEEGGEIEAFALMQKAGYDEAEVEGFYYDLGDVSELIEEVRPSKTAAKRWPYTEAVSIKLRK